jgi:hypothetical protein
MNEWDGQLKRKNGRHVQEKKRRKERTEIK